MNYFWQITLTKLWNVMIWEITIAIIIVIIGKIHIDNEYKKWKKKQDEEHKKTLWYISESFRMIKDRHIELIKEKYND